VRRKKMTDKSPASAVTPTLVMRLYVVNSAPNSLMAIANLASICKEFLEDNFRLEIVDVLEQPLRALADGILVTPSLAKLSPSPAANIVGNLSDKNGVMRALGIYGQAP
jgi:circadian clock protein KaiB